MSQDRNRPPVGAKVLHELYQKYKDRWLVEAVFDVIWRESAETLCSVLFLLIVGNTTDKSLPADIT
jgi:hypothetical protein